ncbi:hypothetical protein [Methylobacterium fujisawaense]|jgi:hypothetical protein
MSSFTAVDPDQRGIGLQDAVRVLAGMREGSPLADLIVHCLLASSEPRESVDFDVLSAMTWLLPMVPGYTTSPVHARGLAIRRGVRIDVRATSEGWSSVGWMPDAGREAGAVEVGAASEALSLCICTAALHARRPQPAAA